MNIAKPIVDLVEAIPAYLFNKGARLNKEGISELAAKIENMSAFIMLDQDTSKLEKGIAKEILPLIAEELRDDKFQYKTSFLTPKGIGEIIEKEVTSYAKSFDKFRHQISAASEEILGKKYQSLSVKEGKISPKELMNLVGYLALKGEGKYLPTDDEIFENQDSTKIWDKASRSIVNNAFNEAYTGSDTAPDIEEQKKDLLFGFMADIEQELQEVKSQTIKDITSSVLQALKGEISSAFNEVSAKQNNIEIDGGITGR